MQNIYSDKFEIWEEIIDGIERVTYTPRTKKYDTPILFQHGMWHGAWCWKPWQELLALNGWESHAISLPSHGKSPAQGSVRFATMGGYLNVLSREIERLPRKPVLIGHSMGGALAQWYLKKVADDLPAVVLVASWTSHSTWADGMLAHLKRDPLGTTLVGLTFSTTPFIRNPKVAASMLITDGATYTPDELHARLDKESAIVLNQHNPPFWKPKSNPHTPMLWIAAEDDAVVSFKGAKASAKFYGADLAVASGAGHNVMMEQCSQEIAQQIADWLKQRTVA